MFKAIAIGLALIAGSNTLQLQHEQSFNIDALSNVQKAADTFIRSKVPNLSGATLASGQQNGNDFNYQYLNQNIPITLTQAKANLVDSNKNIFKLVQATQTLTGPVEGGRLTSIKKSYGVDSFEDALKNLNWK